MTINNTGTVDVKSGALVIAGSVTGTGSIIIENGASLEISGSVAANEILTFAGTTGTVKLDSPPSNVTIAGMAGNDGIDLAGFDSNSITIGTIAYDTVSNTTAVPISDAHGHSTTLTLVGNYTGSTFTPSSDNNGGTVIIDPPASPLVDTASTTPISDFGVGSDTINSGATLELAGASAADVLFANTSGHTGTLVLDNSVSFTGQITGFAGDGTVLNSDSIDLKDINFATATDTYAAGVLSVSDGVDVANIRFSGSYELGNFVLSSDGHGGTLVVDPPTATNDPFIQNQSTDSLKPVTPHDAGHVHIESSSENGGAQEQDIPITDRLDHFGNSISQSSTSSSTIFGMNLVGQDNFVFQSTSTSGALARPVGGLGNHDNLSGYLHGLSQNEPLSSALDQHWNDIITDLHQGQPSLATLGANQSQLQAIISATTSENHAPIQPPNASVAIGEMIAQLNAPRDFIIHH